MIHEEVQLDVLVIGNRSGKQKESRQWMMEEMVFTHIIKLICSSTKMVITVF
jgi:hypothetical protein